MKRAFDLVVATVGLIFSLPLLLLVAVAVRLFDGTPVFFVQKRVGQFGQPFEMYKFRTMKEFSGASGSQLTVNGDKRITNCGNVLRKTKLDEMPQLLNVIKGDMSFVGPRPEVQHYVDKYTDHQKQVLKLKPGITDEASIQYVDESAVLSKSENPEQFYIEVVMPEKIRINLDYAKHSNLWTDIKVVFRTVFRVLNVHKADASNADLYQACPNQMNESAKQMTKDAA